MQPKGARDVQWWAVGEQRIVNVDLLRLAAIIVEHFEW